MQPANHSKNPLLLATCVGILMTVLTAYAQTAYAQDDEQNNDNLTGEEDTLTGEEIVEHSLETNSIGFHTGEATITLMMRDEGGSSQERRLHIQTMEQNGESSSLVRVLAPAEVAGQSYLFREHENREDDVYIYLPAIDNAPRRVAGNQKNSSFMGSDFTYADMESRNLKEATYKRENNESIGGFEVFVVKVTPQNPGKTEDAYARMWIRTSDFIPLRIRFYDEQGNTTRTMFTEQLAKDDDTTYVKRMSLRPESGGATVMIIESADLDAELNPGLFTPQQLAN